MTVVQVVLSASAFYDRGSPPLVPGVPEGPFIHWHADGAATVTGVARDLPYAAASSSCWFNGFGYTESAFAGTGDMLWDCNTGPLAGRFGEGTFTRVGSQMVMVWTGLLNGAFHCFYMPHQSFPTTTFDLLCTGELAGNP